jgi:hypothetical protein
MKNRGKGCTWKRQRHALLLGTSVVPRSRSYFTTDSQSVCLGIEHPCEICDQILLPVGMLLSEICGLVSVGRPLWREDGSAICSVITQWSESLRTRNHTLLCHLRLPQPGGPGSRIYIPQEQGSPVIPPGTGYLFWVLLLHLFERWGDIHETLVTTGIFRAQIPTWYIPNTLIIVINESSPVNRTLQKVQSCTYFQKRLLSYLF